MGQDLSSNQITAVSGILNGTTNYILTKMETEGASFADVLKDAQKKGYAEANPTADIEGLDAARKIVILAAMAFGKRLDPNAIPCEGITRITTEDIELAREMGYAIKLIGHTTRVDGKILAMVSPRLVPADNPLSGINDVFNGILVDANMVGKVMFYGPGAGKLPTASAVVADMIDIMEHTPAGIKAPDWTDANGDEIADFNAYACRSLVILDAPAASADAVAAAFGGSAIKAADGRVAVLTASMTEAAVTDAINGTGHALVNRIRLL